MTVTLQPETKSPSRRALLAGALGGIGAWALSAIGRASPVRGAGDDSSPILVGSTFLDVRTGTYLSDSATSAPVFSAVSSSAGGQGGGIGLTGSSGSWIGVLGTSDSGPGVRGTSSSNVAVNGISSSSLGVWGSSTSGTGVLGSSTSNSGVNGISTSNVGVYGASSASDQPASVGKSNGDSTGVQGHSGGGSLPAPKAKTGVFGYAAQDATSVGVRGESPAGFGVYGKTTGTGFAGYFNGKTFMSQFVEIGEMATPAAPGTNRARLFVRDNGLGKTQLCVRFPTGAVKVLATE
jgi:hypothetical protein